MDYCMIEPLQPQGVNNLALGLGFADITLGPGNFELGHQYTF
jgi:hypothetical protein